MTKSERKEFWFKHYTEYQVYEGSKLSYAELNQLKPRSFYGWCHKFEASDKLTQNHQKQNSLLSALKVKKALSKSSDPVKSRGFIELHMNKQSSTKFKINLPNISIEFNEYPSCDWLAELSRKVG